LLRLALVPHTLNYIAFRTLLLFTFTAKAIMKLASLGIISAVMRTLRRPQEVLIFFLFFSVVMRILRRPQEALRLR
jgi:hypothetical protein